MNGKLSKELRRLAKAEAKLMGTENANTLVSVKGTKRVRTADNGNKVQTETLAYPRKSFRNLLKSYKGRNWDLFDPDENNHAIVA